jgi:hypothetical protein
MHYRINSDIEINTCPITNYYFVANAEFYESTWLPTPSNAEIKAKLGLYIYSPTGPSWSVVG